MKHLSKTIIAAGFCVALLPAGSGHGMTFSQELPSNNGMLVLRFDGDIERGDDLKAIAAYQKAKQQYPGRQPIIYLNSRGGYVNTGAKLAMFIRENKLPVVIEGHALCYSSCFMLFAAGTPRYAGKGATLGVHSVFDGEKGEEDDSSQSTTIKMSRLLLNYGTPPQVVGKLIETQHTSLYKLTDADLQAMQVTSLDSKLDSKPAIVATPAKPAAPVVTATIKSPTTKPVTSKPVPATAKVMTPTPPPTAQAHSLLGRAIVGVYNFVAGK